MQPWTWVPFVWNVRRRGSRSAIPRSMALSSLGALRVRLDRQSVNRVAAASPLVGRSVNAGLWRAMDERSTRKARLVALAALGSAALWARALLGEGRAARRWTLCNGERLRSGARSVGERWLAALDERGAAGALRLLARRSGERSAARGGKGGRGAAVGWEGVEMWACEAHRGRRAARAGKLTEGPEAAAEELAWLCYGLINAILDDLLKRQVEHGGSGPGPFLRAPPARRAWRRLGLACDNDVTLGPPAPAGRAPLAPSGPAKGSPAAVSPRPPRPAFVAARNPPVRGRPWQRPAPAAGRRGAAPGCGRSGDGRRGSFAGSPTGGGGPPQG